MPNLTVRSGKEVVNRKVFKVENLLLYQEHLSRAENPLNGGKVAIGKKCPLHRFTDCTYRKNYFSPAYPQSPASGESRTWIEFPHSILFRPHEDFPHVTNPPHCTYFLLFTRFSSFCSLFPLELYPQTIPLGKGAQVREICGVRNLWTGEIFQPLKMLSMGDISIPAKICSMVVNLWDWVGPSNGKNCPMGNTCPMRFTCPEKKNCQKFSVTVSFSYRTPQQFDRFSHRSDICLWRDCPRWTDISSLRTFCPKKGLQQATADLNCGRFHLKGGVLQ